MPTGAADIFGAFLRLGLSSFGGPMAHLGYLRREFVERRRWIDDAQFAQLLSIAQFLPGPASSQLGFSIGLLRGGWLGGVAAFLGFTLPSALLLFALTTAGAVHRGTYWTAVVHGLKLVAVVVVADGVWRMARQLTPDWPRRAIAIATAALALALATASSQLMAIVVAAILGLLTLRDDYALPSTRLPLPFGTRAATVVAVVSAAALFASLGWHPSSPSLGAIAATFWRAGSLVFGGGHVVLPLLDQSIVAHGWISEDSFLAGYGAAQAIPGPMFAFATYLGALIPTGAPSALGAVVATLAVFTPGLLLIVGVLPVWSAVAPRPAARRAVAGINAAVVGLLAAALYDPVLTTGIARASDLAIVAVAAGIQWRIARPTLWVIACCIAGALLT